MALVIKENVVEVVYDVELSDGTRILFLFLELIIVAGVILPAFEPLLRNQKHRHPLHYYRVIIFSLQELLEFSALVASNSRFGHWVDFSFEADNC